MKKVIAILVFSITWIQAFYPLVTVVQYYAQKDYLSRNVCENRDKPKMHCDGKCCLRKKLAKESKEQAPSQRHTNSEQAITLFFQDTQINIHTSFVAEPARKYLSRNDLRTFPFHHSIFHPPGA